MAQAYAAAKIGFLAFLLLLMYAILAAIHVRPVIHAQVVVLKQDLLEMRQAIDRYTLERQNPLRSLQDLVESQYLSHLPIDPMTGQSDWVIQREPMEVAPDIFTVGITEARSASPKASTEGTPYDSW